MAAILQLQHAYWLLYCCRIKVWYSYVNTVRKSFWGICFRFWTTAVVVLLVVGLFLFVFRLGGIVLLNATALPKRGLEVLALHGVVRWSLIVDFLGASARSCCCRGRFRASNINISRSVLLLLGWSSAVFELDGWQTKREEWCGVDMQSGERAVLTIGRSCNLLYMYVSLFQHFRVFQY